MPHSGLECRDTEWTKPTRACPYDVYLLLEKFLNLNFPRRPWDNDSSASSLLTSIGNTIGRGFFLGGGPHRERMAAHKSILLNQLLYMGSNRALTLKGNSGQ